jgi:hypothetical protein
MSVDRNSLFLIILSSILLGACAQVGTLTGGEKDIVAPKIIKASISNKQRNVNTSLFTFEFDERIILNTAKENLVLVPADAAAKISCSGKTLVLEWDKPWSPNTTYSLYLNALVKDFHEGNDSLYTFVFSSGPSLDTSSYLIQVKDALTNSPSTKILVGLFDSINLNTPRYFARTDNYGMAQINAIKAGVYIVKAFDDENNNLSLDSLEKQGFESTFRTLKNGSKDTISLVISTPRAMDKIRNKKFIPPGLFALHVPISQQNILQLDGKSIPEDQIYREKDSLVLAISPIQQEQFSLIIGGDTLTQMVSRSGKAIPLKVSYNESSRLNSDEVYFEVNDFIRSIEATKISVKSLSDSTKLPVRVNFVKQKIRIDGFASQSGKFFLDCPKGALTGLSGSTNLNQQIPFEIKAERELGILKVIINREGKYIVRLLKDGKLAQQQTVKGSYVRFKRLLPGKYDIQLIEDANENGEWDPVNPATNTQPERIFFFPEATTIRANWEIEKALELN